MNLKRKLSFVFIGALLSTSAAATQSFAVFGVGVAKGGTLSDWFAGKNSLFNDEFDTSKPPVAPNFANGSGASYVATLGASITQPMTGQVVLNPDLGVATVSATGAAVKRSSFTLQTSINASSPYSALDKGSTFIVGGSFSSTGPGYTVASPLSGYDYGIRLADGFSNNNDYLELTIVYTPAGPAIVLRQVDFLLGTTSNLASELLTVPPAALESIDLFLYHDVIGSNTVSAAFRYFSDATGLPVGALHVLSSTGTLFSDEDFTRFQVLARVSAVPEPEVVSLLLLGIVGLCIGRRSRTRRK